MNMLTAFVLLVVVVAIGIAGAIYSSRFGEADDKVTKQ